MDLEKIIDSRQRSDAELDRLHYPIEPADVRHTDRILGRIRLRDSNAEFREVRIWKLSPLGVELYDEEAAIALSKGDAIDLQIVVAGQRSLFQGLVVDVVSEVDGVDRIGIRLSSSTVQSIESESERRRYPRWICSQDFYPTCVALSPGRYNDYIYFQVRDLSSSGVRLVCSLRNKFLLKDMVLKLMMSFPMVGDANATAKIVRVGIDSEGGRDFLVVGAQFVDLHVETQTSIAQYLVQFSNVESLDSLRKQGLLPQSISSGVDFYFLKSEEDYREVLKLRHVAHLNDGNFGNEDVSPEDLSDLRDATGRILVGKYQGRVVATARIHFGDIDTPLEQEQYIKWPNDLPRRDQIVELGRVCTDPSFRRGDLFSRLLQEVLATCIRVERPYVLVVSLPSLVTTYKKLGCIETGIEHEQDFWKGKQHLLLISAFDVCVGKGVNPLVWSYLYRQPAEYLEANGMLKISGMERVRLSVFKVISWLANAIPFVRTKP